MRKLISVKETADFLGVNQFTLYKWLNAGKIPYVKVEGRIRITQEDIEAWVKARRVVGNEPVKA